METHTHTHIEKYADTQTQREDRLGQRQRRKTRVRVLKGEVDLERRRKRGNFIHTSTCCNIDNTSIYISLEMATSLSFTINEKEGERVTHTHG